MRRIDHVTNRNAAKPRIAILVQHPIELVHPQINRDLRLGDVLQSDDRTATLDKRVQFSVFANDHAIGDAADFASLQVNFRSFQLSRCQSFGRFEPATAGREQILLVVDRDAVLRRLQQRLLRHVDLAFADKPLGQRLQTRYLSFGQRDILLSHRQRHVRVFDLLVDLFQRLVILLSHSRQTHHFLFVIGRIDFDQQLPCFDKVAGTTKRRLFDHSPSHLGGQLNFAMRHHNSVDSQFQWFAHFLQRVDLRYLGRWQSLEATIGRIVSRRSSLRFHRPDCEDKTKAASQNQQRDHNVDHQPACRPSRTLVVRPSGDCGMVAIEVAFNAIFAARSRRRISWRLGGIAFGDRPRRLTFGFGSWGEHPERTL